MIIFHQIIKSMKRRTIIKYTAYLTGAALSAPLVSTLLSGCKTEPVSTYKPTFFGEQEFSLIRNIIDTILPTTDSPSATEVGVDQIIDQMVGTAYKTDDKEKYKIGFKALYDYLQPESGAQNFQKLAADKKKALLLELDQSGDEKMKAIKEAYHQLKQQTVAYYLSTEEIGKNYLNYLPVPGAYEACITLEEAGGKKWAL